MRRAIVTVLFLLAFLISGCRKQTVPESEVQIPSYYMIETENYFDYQSGIECAAFASAYLLRHFGEDSDGVELYKNFPSRLPEGGAMPQGIVTLFQERGYDAQFITDASVETLKMEIAKGAPVIVFIHTKELYTSIHDTHYVPAVGYDEEYFYFAESLEEYADSKDETGLFYNRKIEISKFERLWLNIDGVWDNPYYLIVRK